MPSPWVGRHHPVRTERPRNRQLLLLHLDTIAPRLRAFALQDSHGWPTGCQAVASGCQLPHFQVCGGCLSWLLPSLILYLAGGYRGVLVRCGHGSQGPSETLPVPSIIFPSSIHHMFYQSIYHLSDVSIYALSISTDLPVSTSIYPSTSDPHTWRGRGAAEVYLEPQHGMHSPLGHTTVTESDMCYPQLAFTGVCHVPGAAPPSLTDGVTETWRH